LFISTLFSYTTLFRSNLAFMDFYNWDGSKLSLEKQAIVPIITPEEMNASIGEVIEKLKDDPEYTELLIKAFGDEKMTPDRIYKRSEEHTSELQSRFDL